MLGADIDLLRWLHRRLDSGSHFSKDNHDDHRAIARLGEIVKNLEAEQARVPGPGSIPRHPFRKDWA